MKTTSICLLTAMLAATFTSCKKEILSSTTTERKPDTAYKPVILPSNFTNSTNLCNVYFPYSPGKLYISEGQTADGVERIEVGRLNTTKVVNGITCAVIRDKVFKAGLLAEDTEDWYAQDNDGNVWYMGEYVTDFNPDGSVKDHAGSWEAGVNGAKPGIQMLAHPKPGNAYRQEYSFNIAEDEAQIAEVGLTVTTPLGTFKNCIKIREFSAIIPNLNEYKIYAPGLGFIKEINVTDNEEVFLIEVK
jgi:hypothetical protein